MSRSNQQGQFRWVQPAHRPGGSNYPAAHYARPNDDEREQPVVVARMNQLHEETAARLQRRADAERRRNGASEVLQLRPFNPDHAGNSRDIEVMIRGWFEVKQGKNIVISEERSHRHFFRISRITSDADLKQGARNAFFKLEDMISQLEVDSGYQLFVPLFWHANDMFTAQEMHERVHVPTEIQMHAPMPVQYKFLEQLGVSTEEIERSDSMNCLTSKLINHMNEHRIMVREKWTEKKIAKVMLNNDDDDDDIPEGRGYSIKDCMRFMDSHKKFNCYAFDQYGNVLMRTDYSKDVSVTKAPFIYVCHNAHCYQVTNKDAITGHMQRLRAAAKENTDIFRRDKAEEKRIEKENALITLLKREHHNFEYIPGKLSLEKLDTYKDCNLFVEVKCLEPMMLEIFKKTNFIHTGQFVKSAFMRLNYKNGVVVFANPNPKSKINTSFTSRILADRLSVPFKNQSIGAIGVEFCNMYYNPKGGKTKRMKMSSQDRQRHVDRFKMICQICNKKCTGKFELDHKIRLEFGGQENDENIQLLCSGCHDAKTKREVGQTLFNSDQTVSHYNQGSMEIFSRVKNGLIHNYVDYKEYAKIEMHRIVDNDGTPKLDQDGNEVLKQVIVKKDDGSVIVQLDFNKCRTNQIRFEMTKHKYNVFSKLSDVHPFDRKNPQHACIPPGEYYLELPAGTQPCPTHGNDFYTQIVVQGLLATGDITLKNIKWILKAPKDMCLPGDYYTPFVEEVLKRVIISEVGTNKWSREIGVAKECINQFCGMTGIRTSDHKSVDIFTSMEAAALHASQRQAGSTSAEIPVLKRQVKEKKGVTSLMNHGHLVSVMPKVFDSDDKKNYNKNGMLKRADYYSVISQSSKLKTESMMPIFRCILDSEAMCLYQSKRMCEKYGRVLCINVDCVYVQLFDDKKQTAVEKAEQLRIEAEKMCWTNSKVKRYNKMEFALPKASIVDRKMEMCTEQLEYDVPEYEILEDPGFEDKKGAKTWAKKFVDDLMDDKKDNSLMISSLAGTGKTFTTNCIIDELQKREIKFMALAPTHVASHLLGGVDEEGKHIGKTIHSAFSVMKNGNLSAFKKFKVVIVDEFSMVSEMHWAALSKLKRQYKDSMRFLLVGNWAQLESVCSRSSDFDFENASCIHEIVNGRKLVLTKCRRADKGGQELFKQYKYLADEKFDKFDLNKFGRDENDLSIAYYNSTVHMVNDIWMKKYKTRHHIVIKASSKAKTLFNCQDVICYDNLPMMACQTREADGFYNCETWKVKSWNTEQVTLISDDELPQKRTCKIDTNDLADFFRPAYCYTSHKAQGKTIRRAYSIYDWDKMNNRARYVATSRGTLLAHVNVVRNDSDEEENCQDL